MWRRLFRRYSISNLKYVVFLCCIIVLLRPSSSMNGSLLLSVRLSLTPFWLCYHHPVIMKLSGVITNDRGDVHAKGEGQRSNNGCLTTNQRNNLGRLRTQSWNPLKKQFLSTPVFMKHAISFLYSSALFKFTNYDIIMSLLLRVYWLPTCSCYDVCYGIENDIVFKHRIIQILLTIKLTIVNFANHELSAMIFYSNVLSACNLFT